MRGDNPVSSVLFILVLDCCVQLFYLKGRAAIFTMNTSKPPQSNRIQQMFSKYFLYAGSVLYRSKRDGKNHNPCPHEAQTNGQPRQTYNNKHNVLSARDKSKVRGNRGQITPNYLGETSRGTQSGLHKSAAWAGSWRTSRSWLRALLRLGVWKSICKGSGINVPAEERIVWCGRSIGAKYVVGKKQITRLERWACVPCWGPGFTL